MFCSGEAAVLLLHRRSEGGQTGEGHGPLRRHHPLQAHPQPAHPYRRAGPLHCAQVYDPQDGPPPHQEEDQVFSLLDQDCRLSLRFSNDRDVVLVGHVTWVGKSSAEVTIRMEQMVENGDTGNRKHVCEAR